MHFVSFQTLDFERYRFALHFLFVTPDFYLLTLDFKLFVYVTHLQQLTFNLYRFPF